MKYKQLFSVSGAHTVPVEYIGFNKESGWTITGDIQEDYYSWVNAFEATHPTYGWVRGDFEHEVTAKSKKAYDHFMEFHPPELWDYQDI